MVESNEQFVSKRLDDKRREQLLEQCKTELDTISVTVYKILEQCADTLVTVYGDALVDEINEKAGMNMNNPELLAKKTAMMTVLHNVVVRTVTDDNHDAPSRSINMFTSLVESVYVQLAGIIGTYIKRMHETKLKDLVDSFRAKMGETDDKGSKTTH